MKRKSKKIFIVISLIALVFILLFFSPKIIKSFSKASAFSYVQKNNTQLAQTAQSVISGEIKTPYSQDSYKVQYFRSARYPVAEFHGKGFGIAPSGCYTGFYYSPDDIPVRFNGSGTAMESYKNGWAYHEAGDNHGYTEKICDNWYWFEFYF